MVDIMGANHGMHSPNTYIRGTQTIDYVFGTERVNEAVIQCGMPPFNEGIVTDHRALWVDLDLPRLLHGSLTSPPTQLSRPQTKNKKQVKAIKEKTTSL